MAIERVVLTEEQKLEMQAKTGNTFGFDEAYAESWSKMRGSFPSKLANNLIKYVKANNIGIKSVLDICSGSGEFISIMRNICEKCVGCDTADGYINYVKRTYPEIEVFKVKNFYDFKTKEQYDFLSCNQDVVNMFNNFDEWQKFFKNCAKIVKKNGYLMFDFYTEKKLKGANSIVFEEGEELDYVSKTQDIHGKCVFNEVYYVKENSIHYHKTKDIMVETYYPNADILNAVKDAGFEYKFIDMDFNEVKDIDNLNRIHLLCKRVK